MKILDKLKIYFATIHIKYLMFSFSITSLLTIFILLIFIVDFNKDPYAHNNSMDLNNKNKSHAISPTKFQPVNNKKSIHNFNRNYEVTQTSQIANQIRIPVLAYHHIDSIPSNVDIRSYYVTPTMFEQQLRYIYDKRYKTITPKEFYEILQSGKNPKQKTIMLSFDDGHYDNYKNAFPILLKYHMVGVFYIYTNRLFISKEQLQEMSEAGMIIESHSASHTDLTRIADNARMDFELVGSKLSLEKITGKRIVSFAYPGCAANEYVRYLLSEADYKLGFSCGKGIDHSMSNRYMISRVHVFNDLASFQKRLSGVWEATRYDRE